MRIDTPEFDLQNTAKTKKPLYLIRVFFDVKETDFVEFTSHEITENSPGATVIRNVIKKISGTSQKITNNSSTIGSFSFSLVDKNYQVSELIRDKLNAGDGLRRKTVQVFLGYPDLLWSSYIKVGTFLIDSTSSLDGVVSFSCSDIQRIIREDVFSPEKSFLAKTVTATQLHIPVSTADLSKFPKIFHDSSYSSKPNELVGYILIEDEVIAHSGLFTHSTDGPSFQVFPNSRGALNSKAVEHVFNSGKPTSRQLKITEHIFIEGAAPKVAYQLLTGHVAENLILQSEDFTTTWGVTGGSVASNSGTAPNGLATSDRLTVSVANSAHYFNQSAVIQASKSYCASAFVKNDGQQYCFITLWQSNTNYVSAVFDLTAKTLLSNNISTATAGKIGIIDHGDWARIYIVGNLGVFASASIIVGSAGSAEPTYVNGTPSFTGVLGEDLFIWGAQLSQTNYFVPYVSTIASAQKKEVLPDNWNLGVSHKLVRLDDYTRLGDDVWNQFTGQGRHLRFEGHKKTDGKRFIENQIMSVLSAFMIVYSNGQIGLKRQEPILSDSSYVKELDDTNIVKYGSLQNSMSDVVNQIFVDWNFVFQKDDYTKTNALIDLDSISVHQDAPIKEIKFRGVHTGSHTDSDLLNYFDSTRDRHSGPPLKLPLTVLPSLNVLEVGDVVNVKTKNIRDYSVLGDVELNRPFEVQQTSIDWLTGDVKLQLFGSERKAGTLSRSSLSSVLDDAFYDVGTDLASLLTITAGVMTADGNLAGGDSMADAIYRYDGNLTIQNGVTLTINKNVELRIKGHLTIDGKIDGKGKGLQGGLGGTLFTKTGTTLNDVFDPANGFDFETNETPGNPGYLGDVKAPGSERMSKFSNQNWYNANKKIDRLGILIRGNASSINFFSLKNNGSNINGLPLSLVGTSGSGAGGCPETLLPETSSSGFVLNHFGGNAGNSGAGLLIICRSMSFGVVGDIDLSGDDGSPGISKNVNGTNFLFHSGGGPGGHNGGLAVFLDGNSTPPEISSNFTARVGDSPIPAGVIFEGKWGGPEYNYPRSYPFPGRSAVNSSYVLQYIPENEEIDEEIDAPPPDVLDFTAGTSGATVVFRWVEIEDILLDGYEIRFSPDTVNDWDAATTLTAAAKGTRITDTAINDGDWRFYIKAKRTNGIYSQNAATFDATVSSPFDVIVSNQENPLWSGAKTNFVVHHTGKLVPQSQDLAIDSGWDTFDLAVVNPSDTSSYESSELDISFDDLVRVWDEVTGALLPGQTGVTTTTNFLDYRLDAGSYDGFEVWGVGEVNARFIKFKVTLDNTKGLSYLDSQKITADVIERIESLDSQTVGVGGTTINFARAYHSPPHVTATVTGGGALFITASNVTTSSLKLDIYDTTNTSVGGTASWKSKGV